jgi:hypothetical protein
MAGLRRTVAGGARGEKWTDGRMTGSAGPAPCPRLRLLRRQAPRNDVREVGTWDSEPSGDGRGRNYAEQSQFAPAQICLNSFAGNGL